jgi:hypothetical protein
MYDRTARFLGVSRGALRNKVYRGLVPFVRIGPRTVRFDPERISAWLAGREGLAASACGTTNPASADAVAATSKIDKSQAAGKQAKAAVTRARNMKKPTGRPGRNGQSR